MYKTVHSSQRHRLQELLALVATRTKGKQLEIIRTKTEVEKNSVIVGGPIIN